VVSRNPFTSTRRSFASALQRKSSNSVGLVVKIDPPETVNVIDGQALTAARPETGVHPAQGKRHTTGTRQPNR
jgi:hypothetical protein